RSAMAYTVVLGLAETGAGMMEASATRRPVTPGTRSGLDDRDLVCPHPAATRVMRVATQVVRRAGRQLVVGDRGRGRDHRSGKRCGRVVRHRLSTIAAVVRSVDGVTLGAPD